MSHHQKFGMLGRLITGTIAVAVVSAAGAISPTAAASNTTNATPASVAASSGFAKVSRCCCYLAGLRAGMRGVSS
jgi:hypothetical protein